MSNMHSTIKNTLLEELVFESQRQGIQKLVVGAVIKLDGKFLLLERTPSDFMGSLVELPSGAVDTGEDLFTALVREVREETDLLVTVVNAYLGSFDYLSGSGKKSRQFNFLVETEPGEITLSPSEHCAFHLVSLTDENFIQLNISDATKAVLLVAVE